MIKKMRLKEKSDVKLNVYDVCKYFSEIGQIYKKIIIHDVVSFEIVSGKDAIKIEMETDGSCIDDFNEYLILHIANGETSTFRNSYVDMFMI